MYSLVVEHTLSMHSILSAGVGGKREEELGVVALTHL